MSNNFVREIRDSLRRHKVAVERKVSSKETKFRWLVWRFRSILACSDHTARASCDENCELSGILKHHMRGYSEHRLRWPELKSNLDYHSQTREINSVIIVWKREMRFNSLIRSRFLIIKRIIYIFPTNRRLTTKHLYRNKRNINECIKSKFI